MYWELWLSQVTASAALQCMLVRNKGGQASYVDVDRLDYKELNCLAKETDAVCWLEQISVFNLSAFVRVHGMCLPHGAAQQWEVLYYLMKFCQLCKIRTKTNCFHSILWGCMDQLKHLTWFNHQCLRMLGWKACTVLTDCLIMVWW